MAKLEKAKPQQAKLKLGLYGKQGSGKTLTALLIAEGLAALDGKRIAYIDTESGTDFYCQTIPERAVHPAAFDFDRIVTRSIMDALEIVAELDPTSYSVLVIDSITHLWEAAKEAYSGKRMKNGQIPVQAWGTVKKPYKQLMTAFMDSNFHAIICGREGVIMEEDADGETKVVGQKMKAEGETPYDPHILGRMTSRRTDTGVADVGVFFEKDRTGILSGKTFWNPTFDVIKPVIPFLGASEQGRIGTIEDTAERDSAKIEEAEQRVADERKSLYEQIRTAIVSASDVNGLKTAWALTQGKKTKLGDYFEQLEAAKDSRKTELMQGVA